MAIKKAAKKIVSKVKELIASEAPIYNEWGVCINCQGGDPACHHNNLAQSADGLYCNTCGLKVG